MRYEIKYILLLIILMTTQMPSVAVDILTLDKVCEASTTDLSARTNPRKDLNGYNCALIKVYLPISGVRFQGNVVGNIEFIGNEYWVYVSEGSKQLRMNCPGANLMEVSFAKYGINQITGNSVYEVYCQITTPNAPNYTQDDFAKAMSLRETLIEDDKFSEALSSLQCLLDSIKSFGNNLYDNTITDRIIYCRRQLALSELGFTEQGFDEVHCGRVCVEKDGKYGFVDSVGNIIAYPEFEHESSYSRDVAWVKKNGKFGGISLSGAVKIPYEYVDVRWISHWDSHSRWMMASKDGENFGIVDYSDGTQKLPFVYNEESAILGENNESFILFNNKTRKSTIFSYDNCQEIATLPKDITCFYGRINYGLGLVEKCGKDGTSDVYAQGIIDKDGREILPCKYIISKLRVGDNMDDEHIDIVTVSPCEYSEENSDFRLFSLKRRDYLNDKRYSGENGLTMDDWIEVWVNYEDGESYGLVNRHTGEEGVDPRRYIYKNGHGVYENGCQTYNPNKILIEGFNQDWYVFDKFGTLRELQLPENEVEYSFNGGLAEYRKDGKSGFIDIESNIMIPCIYEAVEEFALDYDDYKWKSKVTLNGDTFEIDRNGNRI